MNIIIYTPYNILCYLKFNSDPSSMPLYLKGLRANLFIIIAYRILSSPIPIQFQINFDSISIPIQFQFVPGAVCQLFHNSNKDSVPSPNDPTQLFMQRIIIFNIKYQILTDILFFCAIVCVMVQICQCQFDIVEEKFEIFITILWICIVIFRIIVLIYTLNI